MIQTAVIDEKGDFLKTKDETEYYSTLQEIVVVCLSCGAQNPIGKYTRVQNYDEQYAYSHGFCSLKCAKKQYPDVFSELEAELKNDPD